MIPDEVRKPAQDVAERMKTLVPLKDSWLNKASSEDLQKLRDEFQNAIPSVRLLIKHWYDNSLPVLASDLNTAVADIRRELDVRSSNWKHWLATGLAALAIVISIIALFMKQP